MLICDWSTMVNLDVWNVFPGAPCVGINADVCPLLCLGGRTKDAGGSKEKAMWTSYLPLGVVQLLS